MSTINTFVVISYLLVRKQFFFRKSFFVSQTIYFHRSMFFPCLWLLCFIIVIKVFCTILIRNLYRYFAMYVWPMKCVSTMILMYVVIYLFIYYIFHFLSDSKRRAFTFLLRPGWISSLNDHLSGQYVYNAHFVWTIMTSAYSKNILTKLLYMDIEESHSCKSDKLWVIYLLISS